MLASRATCFGMQKMGAKASMTAVVLLHLLEQLVALLNVASLAAEVSICRVGVHGSGVVMLLTSAMA